MSYIALKQVRFDRNYVIGETIPDDVIAPEMHRKLIRCGVISSWIEETEVAQTIELNDGVQHGASEEPLCAEGLEQEKEFSQYKKAELLELATQLGLNLSEKLTKGEIMDAMQAKKLAGSV